MKNMIPPELLAQLRLTPHLKKKLKVFAIVGAIGFAITSALVVWAGVSLVRLASHQIQAVDVYKHVESLEAKVTSLPTLAAVSCWDKAQSLLTLEPWLTRHITDNFRNLKAACLEAKPPICEGAACQDIKRRLNIAESEQTI